MPQSVLLKRRLQCSLLSMIAVISSGCTQLSFLVANVPASFGDYVRHQDVAYGPDARNTLDVYLPANSRNAPVVVFFHGGGWNSGDKSEYKFVGAALAAHGCIAVLPNYRLYPKARLVDFMRDAARAVAWVYAQQGKWGTDGRNVFLMGHSAGAHIATLLALDETYLENAGLDANKLRGVVGLAGPYDFIPFRYPYMFDLFGPEAEFARSQPINYVRADAPPFFLLHGLKDTTVVPGNTEHLSAALSASGARVMTKFYASADHGDLIAPFSIPARKRLPVLDDVLLFMNDCMTVRTDATAVARRQVADPGDGSGASNVALWGSIPSSD